MRRIHCYADCRLDISIRSVRMHLVGKPGLNVKLKPAILRPL